MWVASSIDGTDPQARRPGGGHALVTAIWNDHRDERTINISLKAPSGTSFEQGTWQAPRQNSEDFGVAFNDGSLQSTGQEHSLSLTLPGRSVWVANIPLAGQPLNEAEVSRKQFFAQGILQDVIPGKDISLQLDLDTTLETASKATLRCVLEHCRGRSERRYQPTRDQPAARNNPR